MKFRTAPAPHLPPASSVSSVMREVLIALIPAAVAYVWFFGWGLVFNIVIATAFAVLFEALMLKLRSKHLGPFLGDYSAIVAAVLLAFALPPLTPWWITVTGVAFAIVVAKHLYGGLGFNPFNPAMAAYAMLLVTFPLEMSIWLPPAIEDMETSQVSAYASLIAILTGSLPDGVPFDAISAATALDYLKTGQAEMQTMGEMQTSPLFGSMGARGWEWVANGFLLGGLWLMYKRIIRWHIPFSMLAGLFVISGIFYAIDADAYTSPFFNIFSGATMIGAFFIATDPVSTATSNRGRIIFGLGAGVLTYVIRTWGGYPDGVAFAVLIMNMTVPVIDHFTVPRIYGHEK
ncbi:MAG: electron transport complex subunit RsxD [Pseudomonadota bacterium]